MNKLMLQKHNRGKFYLNYNKRCAHHKRNSEVIFAAVKRVRITSVPKKTTIKIYFQY